MAFAIYHFFHQLFNENDRIQKCFCKQDELRISTAAQQRQPIINMLLCYVHKNFLKKRKHSLRYWQNQQKFVNRYLGLNQLLMTHETLPRQRVRFFVWDGGRRFLAMCNACLGTPLEVLCLPPHDWSMHGSFNNQHASKRICICGWMIEKWYEHKASMAMNNFSVKNVQLLTVESCMFEIYFADLLSTFLSYCKVITFVLYFVLWFYCTVTTNI